MPVEPAGPRLGMSNMLDMPKRGPAGSTGITGALLQEGVGDLVVNVLLEHVLVRVCGRMWPLRYCSRVDWQKRMSW